MTAPRSLAPTLAQPVARVLLAAFAAVHLLLAWTGGEGGLWTTWVAYLLSVGAATWVVFARRLGTRAAWVIAAALVVSPALTVLSLPAAGWPGYAAWPLGATTFVALALTLRDRIGVAWAAMAGMVVVCVAWSLQHGNGPLPGVNLVIRQAGTLLIGTLFATGIARAARSVDGLARTEQQRLVERAVTAAAGVEQRRTADHVLALVTPALEMLVRRTPLTAANRGDLLALEGRLRDEISAGPLPERWTDASRRARQRGVDVLLLQDEGVADSPGDQRDAATSWLADHLDAVASGSFTARIVRGRKTLRVSAGWENDSDVTEVG